MSKSKMRNVPNEKIQRKWFIKVKKGKHIIVTHVLDQKTSRDYYNVYIADSKSGIVGSHHQLSSKEEAEKVGHEMMSVYLEEDNG